MVRSQAPGCTTSGHFVVIQVPIANYAAARFGGLDQFALVTAAQQKDKKKNRNRYSEQPEQDVPTSAGSAKKTKRSLERHR